MAGSALEQKKSLNYAFRQLMQYVCVCAWLYEDLYREKDGLFRHTCSAVDELCVIHHLEKRNWAKQGFPFSIQAE